MTRVLVTGGAGFIGSHLTERLLAQGDEVTVVDDLSTGRLENLAAVIKEPRFRWVEGSLGDQGLVDELVGDVEHVYHLAAAVGVALIAKEPIRTIERNVNPTLSVLSALEARHQAGVPVRFFLASSSEVYGKNPKPVWHEEDDLVFGSTTRARWSYGASKAIDEFLALGYWRQFHLPCVIGRFFNVIGPRQTGAYGMVAPRFVQAAVRDEPLVVHDDGQQVRCFADVIEIVDCVIRLMQNEASLGQVFNIGSDQPVTILELAQAVIAEAGSDSPIEYQTYAEAYDEDFEDIRCRVPDVSKLRAAIGTSPRLGLRSMLSRLVNAERASQGN